MNRMALKQFIDSRNRNSELAYLAMQQSQRHSVLICKMENDFVNHIKTPANQFYGLSLANCHALVYEFTLINNRQLDKRQEDLGLLMLAYAHNFSLRQRMAQLTHLAVLVVLFDLLIFNNVLFLTYIPSH